MLSAKAKSKADARRFFMLMGGTVAAVVAPPGGDCDPYSRPLASAANLNLASVLARISNTPASVNLCEEMT